MSISIKSEKMCTTTPVPPIDVLMGYESGGRGHCHNTFPKTQIIIETTPVFVHFHINMSAREIADKVKSVCRSTIYRATLPDEEFARDDILHALAVAYLDRDRTLKGFIEHVKHAPDYKLILLSSALIAAPYVRPDDIPSMQPIEHAGIVLRAALQRIVPMSFGVPLPLVTDPAYDVPITDFEQLSRQLNSIPLTRTFQDAIRLGALALVDLCDPADAHKCLSAALAIPPHAAHTFLVRIPRLLASYKPLLHVLSDMRVCAVELDRLVELLVVRA